MAYGFLDIAATPAVKAAQAAHGAAEMWADFKGDRAFDRFTEDEAAFIAARDHVYMATVSESGWPYVQHRGGPAGFLKVLDEKTLGLADFRGNRQYISVGNLSADNRAALILMDYARRARMKIFARVEMHDVRENYELAARLETPGYKAKIERALLFHLEAFDWNCPQHITPRFTEAEISAALAPTRARLAELQAENDGLRARLVEMETRYGSRTPASAAVHDA